MIVVETVKMVLDGTEPSPAILKNRFAILMNFEIIRFTIFPISISEQIKSGNFEKGIYFKIDQVKSKTDSETFSAKQKLEYRNVTSYVQLSK